MYDLSCLICHSTPDSLPSHPHRHGALVALQEHVMEDHGYSVDELRASTRIVIDEENAVYQWAMPDGVLWMEARKRMLVPA